MDADGTNVKQLTSNTAVDGLSDWSPDGSKIAFCSNRDGDLEIYREGDLEIYVMDADGTNIKKLTSNSAYDGSPDWSPDGSKITFTSDKDGDYEIYVMNADGTNVKQLTKNTVHDLHSAWSPDGSKITFASFDGSNPEIYVMDADGTNVKKRTNTLSPTINEGPCWSPDGNKIAPSCGIVAMLTMRYT